MLSFPNVIGFSLAEREKEYLGKLLRHINGPVDLFRKWHLERSGGGVMAKLHHHQGNASRQELGNGFARIKMVLSLTHSLVERRIEGAEK